MSERPSPRPRSASDCLSAEYFACRPPVVGLINSGEGLLRKTGDGVADSGGRGRGPVGAGFWGGISSASTTRGRRFAVGLATLLRGELESVDIDSAVSDCSAVVAKELVADTADMGIVSSSLDSLDISNRSLIQERCEISEPLREDDERSALGLEMDCSRTGEASCDNAGDTGTSG